MKTIKTLFVFAIAIAITSLAKAQQYNYKLDGPFAITKALKVNGVCEMCKNRIENAINKSGGIWSANWEEGSKILVVKYDKLKTDPDKIQQVIASVGHDTEKFKASDNTYEMLPDCCHYARR
jgi:copper chaperone CopZ